MSGESSDSITRVLFCGPHFPASHNYTIEYLQTFPFIKVPHFLIHGLVYRLRLVVLIDSSRSLWSILIG